MPRLPAGLLVSGLAAGGLASARGITLSVRPHGSSEYKAAIIDAAKDVELFAELLQNHSDSSARLIRDHLITNAGFTEDGAERASEAFLAARDLVSEHTESILNKAIFDPLNASIQVGDLVQWTSQGIAQFSTPRKVTRIEEKDGEKYAAVLGDDGKEGWAPMAQLTVEKQSEGSLAGSSAFKPPVVNQSPLEPGMEESRWKLPSGHAVLRLPAKLTTRDFQVLKRQIELLEFSVTGEESKEE